MRVGIIQSRVLRALFCDACVCVRRQSIYHRRHRFWSRSRSSCCSQSRMKPHAGRLCCGRSPKSARTLGTQKYNLQSLFSLLSMFRSLRTVSRIKRVQR
jgi:hypothetical protein